MCLFESCLLVHEEVRWRGGSERGYLRRGRWMWMVLQHRHLCEERDGDDGGVRGESEGVLIGWI